MGFVCLGTGMRLKSKLQASVPEAGPAVSSGLAASRKLVVLNDCYAEAVLASAALACLSLYSSIRSRTVNGLCIIYLSRFLTA